MISIFLRKFKMNNFIKKEKQIKLLKAVIFVGIDIKSSCQ